MVGNPEDRVSQNEAHMLIFVFVVHARIRIMQVFAGRGKLLHRAYEFTLSLKNN